MFEKISTDGIVASVILMLNGTLIPDVLKKVALSRRRWKASELQAVNKGLLELIKKESGGAVRKNAHV